MSRDDPDLRRHSVALSADLIEDDLQRAEAEARNGFRQFDMGMHLVEDALARGSFRLRVSMILTLHRAALDGISAYAGNFRPGAVEILGSRHRPVDAYLVPGLVEELCDHVNDLWEQRSAIHLASYVMWRLNWIHPFADGNGRTSRVLSYVVLCARLGFVLPGLRTIPEQIQADRQPYFRALDLADAAWAGGHIDVSAMEALLDGLLANQLLGIYKAANTHNSSRS